MGFEDRSTVSVWGRDEEQSTTCRGSIALGSGCGTCAKCAAEMLSLMPEYRARLRRLEVKLQRLLYVVPPPPPASVLWDINTELKASLFNEVRRVVHEKEG